MSYALADFLSNQNNVDIRQITRCNRFNEIQIQSVSVQEFPLDNFIQENELVLSTAIGCDTKPENFRKMVESAIKAHASAIFFAFSSSRFQIPKSVIQFADNNNFPLFEIPWEYRFSEIQSAIYRAIEKEEQSFWVSLQNQLCNLFFESATLDVACETIGSALNCSTAIVDQIDTMIGSAFREEEEDLCKMEDAPFQADIKVRDILYGKLYLWGNYDDRRVYPENDSIKKSLLFPLSLWFNQKSFEDSMKEKMKNEFVCNLALGRYSSYEEMLQQGIYLKFDLKVSYTCISVKRKEKLNEMQPMEMYSTEKILLKKEIENHLVRAGRRLKLKIMVGMLENTYVVFVENREIHGEEGIKSYIKMTDKFLTENYPNDIFYWGISGNTSDQLPFEKIYYQSALGIQYLLTSDDNVRIYTYRETQKALIMSCLSENSKIKEAASEIVGGLLDQEKDSSMDLLETLSMYLKSNYNVSQTARELHIHRQSLLYRLDKIENITGMKLDRHEDLFVLEVFTRIYKDY